MNTLENNRLIAEFMGRKRGRGTNIDKITYINPNGGITPLRYLNYDKDWNQLMKVVSKVENLDLRKYTVKISYDICSIDYTNIKSRLDAPIIFKRSIDQSNKIEAVYNAVTEFIKWYNQNK